MADSKPYVPLAPQWHGARDGLDRWPDPAAHIQRSAVNDFASGTGARILDRATGFPPSPGEQSLLQLQRRYGNRYVQRLMASARQETAELQRAYDPGSPMLQRVHLDDSGRKAFDCENFAGDKKLEACLNNEDRLRRGDNGPAVKKVQGGLLADGEDLGPKQDDGDFGTKTEAAVRTFKKKYELGSEQFGDVGPGTMAKLDELCASPKPSPTPTPQNATLTAACGTDQQAGKVVVTGTGFPPGSVDLIVDRAGGNSAIADAKGNFSGSVPSNLKDGSHVVEASAGSVRQSAQFTTPCGAPPGPKPGPGNEELETVLNRIGIAYQLLLTRERDGVLALCRDLTNLDKPGASAAVEVLTVILTGLVSFLFGFTEGAIRQAIKSALTAKLGQGVANDYDEANNQVVSAILQAGQGVIAKAGDRNIKNRTDLLAGFCDSQLEQVTQEGFAAADKFETDGKKRFSNPAPSGTKHDTRNQSGDPRVDVALGELDAVDQTAAKAFQIHYDAALDQWDSKLAQQQLGVSEQNVKDTNLEPLKGSADIPTGVLDILLDLDLSGKGERVAAARIDGLSERVRTVLQGRTGGDLHLPIVAEGSTGARRMRIGVTESHESIVDLTTSNSGGQWLTERGDGDRRQGVLRVADTVLKARMPEIEAG
jgi:peptidoglycan hydrolase-like protein with peptidoglycan-binding domain